MSFNIIMTCILDVSTITIISYSKTRKIAQKIGLYFLKITMIGPSDVNQEYSIFTTGFIFITMPVVFNIYYPII